MANKKSRVECSDTVTFFRELKRMCNCSICGEGCLMDKLRLKHKCALPDIDLLMKYPKEAVAIVQKWSDAHPNSQCEE